MKVLFIGGSGNISAACSRLAMQKGIEVFMLNRGNVKKSGLENAVVLKADYHNPEEVRAAVKGMEFDVVANFIAYKPEDVQQDIEIFSGKTKQYVFISSASCYQKPQSFPVITESTPLANPYWDYSRDKIACEELLQKTYREQGFPMTIVRPSHTYETVIPVAVGSWEDYTLIDWMKKGKPVIVHGDGSSLWTLTHSEDFAKAFVGLLGHQQALGHAFHITSDEVLNWNQIYEAVAEAAGVEPSFVYVTSEKICEVADSLGMEWMRGNLLGDKTVSSIFDNAKIKRFVPDYVATIPFRKGIKDTIKWFESDPSRMVIDKDNVRLMETILEVVSS